MIRALALCCLASPALAAPHVTAEDTLVHDVHVRLDTDATWGVGSQMFFGFSTRATAQLPVWHGRGASGSFDLGLGLAYDNEGSYFAFWLDPDEVRGAGHRVATTVRLGHTFHIGRVRRVGFGIHVWGGHNAFVRQYTVTYAAEDFEGSGREVRHAGVVGGDLDLSIRLAPRVGLHLLASAPLPTASSYEITLGRVGLGLSWFLR